MTDESFEEYLEMARALLGGCESPADLWEANDLVNMALRILPRSVEAWILKSQILSSLEDDLSALASAEMAVHQAPKIAETHYVKAAVLADLELFEEALQHVDQAFQLVGRRDKWLLEDLYYEKGTILDALGHHEEAKATFEAGLRRFPQSSLLLSGFEPLRKELRRSSFVVIDGGKRN